MNDVNNRWFNGRPVSCDLSPVTDFREACCRQYELGYVHPVKLGRSLMCLFHLAIRLLLYITCLIDCIQGLLWPLSNSRETGGFPLLKKG